MKHVLQPQFHVPDHFFNGVCICPCIMCLKKGDRNFVQCICPSCPYEAGCGLKTMRTVGV